MKNVHIERVVLAEDGIVVTYTDRTSAFYHESVLMTHLAAPPVPVLLKRPARRVPGGSDEAGELLRRGRRVA